MIWEAFILGFLGSLHCVIMCGPLLLSIASSGYSKFTLIIHHVGRWIGYILLAIIFQIVVSPLKLFEAQQHIGLFSGLLLVTYSLKNKIPFLNKGFVKLTYFLSVQMQKYTSSAMGSVVLGILNGLLPCGLSFGAAILSMNEPTTIRAALFMIIFGFGTTPLLGLVNLVPTFSWRKSWFKFQRYIPILLLVLGCLIVIRSMGLGVPYLSPTFDAEKVELSCCSSLPN